MKEQDQLYRYLFEHYQVRGELVQLDQTFRHMVAAQEYPAPVRQLLGELLVERRGVVLADPVHCRVPGRVGQRPSLIAHRVGRTSS